LFTAQIVGTGAFNPAVTWSVNGVNGGNSTYGTIVGGQYTAPAVLPNPSAVTITATSVQAPLLLGTATAIVYAPAVLTSITPNAASASQEITISGQNLLGPTTVVFSGINGTSIPMPVQFSNGQIVVTVPFGATTGPIYMTLTPFQGISETTTNSITLTRLPNLRVHASNKDLSSGETVQLDWRLLGASTPNTIKWTTDSGSISTQGMFQAPIVSAESYSKVTGCLEGTVSCDSILLRILPFRISPPTPIVNGGDTIQLDAVQGGSLLSPQWSVLAGGGSIMPGGLFTAPTTAAQAGGVQIAANAGSTTEQTSVAVSGMYPGLVNRVFDYADFTTFTPKEATFVKSVRVSGNRAYALSLGAAFQSIAPYQAIDVYDISNPDQPVWIDAVEAANNEAADLFVFGNALFSIDSTDLVVYSLASQPPVVTEIVPIETPFNWTLNNGVLYVLPFIQPGPTPTTMPIDLYDMSTGVAVHSHYELPNTAGGVGQLWGISGKGNIVYVSGLIDIDNTPTFTIATYDISQSPPKVVSTVVSTSSTEYRLQVVGNLLFADSQIYDISNVSPVQITTLPVPIEWVWGVEGTNVLVSGGSVLRGNTSYAVVDISSPANPVVTANVADPSNWDIYNPATATWANNGRFYAADGTGGFAVYNVATSGGPTVVNIQAFYSYIYDQVVEQQTLYAAVLQGSGAGGLACFDVSSGTPNQLGSLLYPNDSSFTLQVSGTTVFLGLADSLKVVDASNPQAPVEIASVAIPVNALALSGSTLFAGTSDGRLVVFDVSTPASPKQLASAMMPAPSTMRVSGTVLLVAAGQNGLLIFDVSHPGAPKMLSQFSPSVSAPLWDVVSLGGSALMLAADSSGIVTVDISDPVHPQQLYQQPLPYLFAFPNPFAQAGIVPAFSLATQNDLTYVGTSGGLMFAFDATVPAVPRLVAMNAVGAGFLDTVAAISPGANKLFLAVQGVTLSLDNSVPQNSIELYYPPAALSVAVPLTNDVRSQETTANLTASDILRWLGKAGGQDSVRHAKPGLHATGAEMTSKMSN